MLGDRNVGSGGFDVQQSLQRQVVEICLAASQASCVKNVDSQFSVLTVALRILTKLRRSAGTEVALRT